MSYHRGGHPGAVAVSYNSASTMAPLSPSRRYSGSNGSSAGGTSSTSGSSTSKYSYRATGGDRPGSYYLSASTTGYRASSFTSSSDSYRRPCISPARSVSSYTETGSIVGSSAGSLRYSSASSSSASSTTSSISSCGSRDRNGFHHPTPGSLATSTADLYAKYSPTNYVPNIYGSSSAASNGHWRPSSSNSSSGVSSVLPELHGGDEYDSCRDRRGRSYSSEASSGLALSSNSSSGRASVASPNLAERWSTRREAKRKTSQGPGTGGTVLAGHAQRDSAAAPTEVTLIVDGGSSDTSGFDSSSSSNRRAAASLTTTATATTATSAAAAAAAAAGASIIDALQINDRNGPTDDNCENDDENPDSRDLDNSNAQNNQNNNNNNDRDSLVERKSGGALEQRRRRRRGNVEQQQRRNGDSDDRDDCNGTTNVNNETVVARDFNNDRSNCSERSGSARIGAAGGDSRVASYHHHHGRAGAADGGSRGLLFSASTGGVVGSPETADNADNVVATAFAVNSSTASSLFAVSPSLETPARSAAPAVALSNGESRDVASSSDGGGGGAGGDARRHRTAYTWTKIPTNPDNTELLTNNNGQDREGAVLGIVETSAAATTTTATRIRERPSAGGSGTRKPLLWTATSEKDGVAGSCDETPGDEERKDDGGRSTLLGNPVPVVTNDDNDEDDDDDDDVDAEDASGTTNGLGIQDGAENSNSGIYDINGDESNGISVRINGVSGRPSGTRSDESGKPSTSRKTLFAWNDLSIDDPTASASSATTSSNSAPVAVHQNLNRGGLSEQIDEGSRPARNRLQSRRDERYGLNGLRNIGNTCFMNSVIQCLSNTRPLLEYLLNEQHLLDINTTTSGMKGALIKAFGQVIHELWEMSGDHVVNTTALKSQIQRFAPRFMGYSQQDAQEFLRYLLEGLHEDVNRVTVKPQPILTDIPDHYSDSHKAAESWKRYLRSEDSTIVDVFVGQLRSSLQCTSCDHVSVTLDPFWDLSLPIPARSGTVKLNQCLEHFTKVETMDGDEKPTCSKCQMRRKCTKSFSIQKFPKILVIHLKRFSPTERFRGKLSVLVDFPLTGLDLSAFAAPSVQGCTYNLYGVANHSGTTYSGHYTAYCKHPYSGEWHEYNDNRVSTVPARSVVSSEAYVLFYEQQPLNPHL